MIHVIAHITTQKGKRAEVLELFHAIVPAVHAEEGCIEYTPVIDASGFEGFATPLGEDGFIVVEKWQTAEHLKAHGASAHMANYAEQTKGMIADRAIYVLSGSQSTELT